MFHPRLRRAIETAFPWQVSQLKRLNNIQNDQDFYALAHCRVPVHRFGSLHASPAASAADDYNAPTTMSMPVTHLSQDNHQAFFDVIDQDLATMRTKVEQCIEIPSSMTTTADGRVSHPWLFRSPATRTIEPVRHSKIEFNCDGADCGCTLWQTVALLILIALLPLVYIFFFLKARYSNP